MKYPIFSEQERHYILNFYNNKIIYHKTILIERYELLKSISIFKKEVKKWIRKILH